MPAAIVFAAGALSVSAGAGAIAAGSAVIGGLMVAGGALSMIGAVTGNKYATRYGGYLSLAGGVAQIGSKMAETLAAETAKGAAEQSASKLATESLSQSAAPAAQEAAADAAVSSAAETAATDTAASQAGQELAKEGSQSAATDGLISSGMGDAASGAASDLASFPASTVAEPVGGLETNWYKSLIPETSSNSLTNVSNGVGEIGAPWEQGFTDLSLGEGGVAQNAADMAKANTSWASQAPATEGGSWLDKAESMAKGIEKYKTTATLATGVIGGALQQNSAKKAAKEAAEAQVAGQLKLEDERRKRYNASVANLALPRVTRKV